ncbi:hypothetical protein [Paenibacillus sp. OAS669]|uniref:hypothetical protein n=1 Tax=Paenibacillus sp. OAS669 TaxID=2663821 RepID=UPI0017892518|nr:hypothetical protein [Paenibacillus sp. OAS669]MBE1445702.1 hypothetical protein [Paenibacillus sp. OAS669]
MNGGRDKAGHRSAYAYRQAPFANEVDAFPDGEGQREWYRGGRRPVVSSVEAAGFLFFTGSPCKLSQSSRYFGGMVPQSDMSSF